MFKVISVAAMIFAACLPASMAQEAVGRAMVDGKTVILFSDFSWEYESAGDAECQVISRELSFCGSSLKWRAMPNEGGEVAAMYRYDDRNYAMVVVEDLGIEDGLTKDFMRKAVIENAASGAGVPVSAVTVFENTDTMFGESEAVFVAYGLAVDNLPIVYANTIVTKPNSSYQLITYAVGRELTDEQKVLHVDFIDSMQLK